MPRKIFQVDLLRKESGKWQEETVRLRSLALGFGLHEEVKWGKPCFSHEGGNVVLIQGFKEYCALLFFKGALLKDAEGILHRMGENTQAGRQIRFTGMPDIEALAPVVKAYIAEAIGIERAGLKVELKKGADLEIPPEFRNRLDSDADLNAAFLALSPGRQRLYCIHFSEPKQASTKEARIDRCIPKILLGKGLNE
jgi:uncharacterized protein YdeI (YjbR/CyaY-like superfamily)